ncbi:hypothetical protein MRBLMI12_000499 [Microbacterium sp. LMI12-1-1.1]|uniref:hypothetical protein n=1 Tax=Microbacterium sp. LMI12-1-1.1 TaxID=3135225 RepID=UPI00342FDAB2
MATTAQHINSRNDPDLLDRFVAAAEQAGLDGASAWVQANMGRLVSTPVEAGQTVADVHAYADEVRAAYIDATPLRAGANPGAVTDIHLATAIGNVKQAQSVAPTP